MYQSVSIGTSSLLNSALLVIEKDLKVGPNIGRYIDLFKNVLNHGDFISI